MDKRKEILSALIDDEASEIEVHRLVRELGDDPESDDALRRDWALYQHLRWVARSGEAPAILSPEQHEALHQRISESIAAEDTHAARNGSERQSRKLSMPFSMKATALAASVALIASLVALVVVNVAREEQPVTHTLADLTFKDAGSNETAQARRATASSAASNPVAATPVTATPVTANPVTATPVTERFVAERLATEGFAARNVLAENVYAERAEGLEADPPELMELDEEKQRQIRNYLRQHDLLIRMNQQFVNFQDQNATQSQDR